MFLCVQLVTRARATLVLAQVSRKCQVCWMLRIQIHNHRYIESCIGPESSAKNLDLAVRKHDTK